MHSQDSHGQVILCGLGNLGCRVASLFCRLGRSGHIITLEAGEHWRRNGTDAFKVILGNAREEQHLRAAGIMHASVLLALTDDDIANVDICLEARRLNPCITVIARTQDEDLAVHLERSGLVHRAFCTASLAVPAFSAAARGDRFLDTIEHAGRLHDLERVLVSDAAQGLGATVADWERRTGGTVLALREAGCPTRAATPDTPLRAGTVLHCLHARPPAAKAPGSPLLQSLHRLGLGLRQSWTEVPNAFRLALAFFGLVVLLSIVLFHFALGLPWVDAVYFVCTTITTVGYGDINLQQAAPWLKLYGSFLMLCSAGLLATLCSIITNLLLQTRLRDVLSRGCSHQRGHLVIVGLGNVGYRLVGALLASGEKVVAVDGDRDGRYVEAVKRLAPVVHGDARIPSTLELAGLPGAKALVVVTSHDIENIAIGLASKRAAPVGRVILRLFDAKLAESMGKGPQIDALLSVSTIAAPHLVAAGLRKDTLKGLLLEDLLIVLFPASAADSAQPGMGVELHPLRPATESPS